MAEEKEKTEEKKEETRKEKSQEKTSEKPAVEEEEKTVEEEAPKKEPEKEEVEIKIPEKFKAIVKEIEEMKLVDLADLVKILEKKFGISAVPMAAAMAPTALQTAGGEGAAPAGGEKKTFNIVLTGGGEKKIEVIKVVKEITQKGLKDCKDLVDALASEPQTIRENAKKEEAEEAKKKLEAAGASVELR